MLALPISAYDLAIAIVDHDDIQIGVTVHEADHGLIEYCCQTRFAGAQRLFGGFLAGYHLYGADNDRLVGGRPDMARGHSSPRSEEHTSELQSLMRISYAVFCLKKKHK